MVVAILGQDFKAFWKFVIQIFLEQSSFELLTFDDGSTFILFLGTVFVLICFASFVNLLCVNWETTIEKSMKEEIFL